MNVPRIGLTTAEILAQAALLFWLGLVALSCSPPLTEQATIEKPPVSSSPPAPDQATIETLPFEEPEPSTRKTDARQTLCTTNEDCKSVARSDFCIGGICRTGYACLSRADCDGAPCDVDGYCWCPCASEFDCFDRLGICRDCECLYDFECEIDSDCSKRYPHCDKDPNWPEMPGRCERRSCWLHNECGEDMVCFRQRCYDQDLLFMQRAEAPGKNPRFEFEGPAQPPEYRAPLKPTSSGEDDAQQDEGE